MKRCPRCGANVADPQQFCGSCGYDMRAVPTVPAPRVTPPVSEGQGSPYAYPQPVSPYSPGLPETTNGQSPTMRYAVIGAVVLIVACCCFLGGVVVGGFAEAWVSGMASPPTVTPRPRTAVPGGALISVLWFLLP